MNRRDFMRRAGGVAGAGAAAGAGSAAVAGPAAAQEEEPAWPDFVQDAPNFETTDMRGEEEVTVEVGTGAEGHEFEPAAVWVDQGATVVWEWTGEGGGHNVVTEEGPADLESEITDEEGFTYEHAFEEEGITSYYCEPHRDLGMVGGVAAGEVETVEAGAGAMDPHEMGVQIREHYVGVGAILSIIVSLIFTFYVLKYGESPHAGSGRDR